MKRMLMLTSVASMIDQFNMPNIELLQEMGYAVDVACNFKEGNTCSDEEILELQKRLDRMHVRCYQIDFARDVTALAKDMKALWQVEHLLKKNEYDFLHCHSPIGGVVGRLAGKATGTKVIYTAHGFHFYKGAPTKNWLVYYPIEKFCSKYTDTLITINQEDYALAQKKMKAERVVYVPGVGIDLEKFGTGGTNSTEIRKSLDIPESATWLLSVGELIKRKNHETLIRAVAKVNDLYLTIAGQGELNEYLQHCINELGVSDRVKLLGFRTDISELCDAADVFALPSFQEGLSVALMEAMASGKTVVCSRIRGNVDLIDDGKGGILFEPSDVDGLARALNDMKACDLKTMGAYNAQKIRAYDIESVLQKEKSIYSEIIGAGRPKTQNQKFKVEDGTEKMSDTEIESQNSTIVKNENNSKVENEGRTGLVFGQPGGV